MDLLLQYVANGIVTGSTYVLVSVGLTLIFGILGVVNFAHGEFYTIGAYAGIIIVSKLGVPIVPAIGLVLIVCALLGVVAEAILNRSVERHDATSSIISSFGVAIVMQNLALLVFGPQPQILRTGLSNVPIELGPVFLPLPRLLIPVVALVLVGGLACFLQYTWMGRSLRAMSQHAVVARLCGVRVHRVAIATFMVGAALAGVAGMLMSSVFLVNPLIGNMIVLKAFTVVILGGMGNVAGAALAGLLLGVTESLTSAYLANSMRDVVGFIVVILVLLLRPNGLFSRAAERS